MLNVLKNLDPELVVLPAGEGNILVSNQLQGRIFAEIGGTLLHRFDGKLAADPDPVNFNNLGGNSLWPAPEGGAFAFNYPPRGDWYVQGGINSQKSSVKELDISHVLIEKHMELLNRKGKRLGIQWSREVRPLPVPECTVPAVSYTSTDKLIFDEPQDPEEAVVAAWSLEQFPGASGIIAFGSAEKDMKQGINTDFYGNPLPRLTFKDNWFRFALGGPDRLQIGIDSRQSPRMIGAFDPARGVGVVRTTLCREDGKRINFADNDQLNGVYSSSDQYSIFNGAELLKFHELETLAPMTLDAQGRVLGSRLDSQSTLLLGSPAAVKGELCRIWGVPEEFLR